MMRAFLATMLVLLASCNNGTPNNGTSNNGTPNNGTTNDGTAISDSANSGSVDQWTTVQPFNKLVIYEPTYLDEDDLKYFPFEKYVEYPVAVQELIRQAEIENDYCRSNARERLYRCNRRDEIMAKLEKKGWCWGGADVGYLMHWLKCSDDPYYKLGGDVPNEPYTDEEIKEVMQSQSEWNENLGIYEAPRN